MKTLDYALAYADYGLRLFACAHGTKVPLAGTHGHLDASSDRDCLRETFPPGKRLNIALACAASGLVVVDKDVRSGGDETLGALERTYGPLPHTPRVISGSGDGSEHHYFRPPAGLSFPKQLGPGVDLKHNGYVLLPPSTHRSGGVYRWDLGALLSETPIAPCPDWIARLARERREISLAVGPASKSFVGVAFRQAGMLGRELPDDKIAVRCPWAAEHSDGRGSGDDSSTALLPPTTDDRLGTFVCSHGHCGKRRTLEALRALPEEALAVAAAEHPAAYARVLTMLGRIERRAA